MAIRNMSTAGIASCPGMPMAVTPAIRTASTPPTPPAAQGTVVNRWTFRSKVPIPPLLSGLVKIEHPDGGVLADRGVTAGRQAAVEPCD